MTIQNFETERLNVCHWGAVLPDPERREELERNLRVLLSPAVLAPLPPSMQLDRSATPHRWIEDRNAESDVYSVVTKADNKLIGLLILAFTDARTVHLGYLLAEESWGKGYASELVQGLAVASASHLLVGGVATDNPASARVLIKAGFEMDAKQCTLETVIYVNDLR